jgi:hypothetical protein
MKNPFNLGATLLLTAAQGCSGGEEGSGGAQGTLATSVGCSDGSLTATVGDDEVIEIGFDGRDRAYQIQVPPDYDGSTPLPLPSGEPPE